jgi:hypothetical protein
MEKSDMKHFSIIVLLIMSVVLVSCKQASQPQVSQSVATKDTAPTPMSHIKWTNGVVFSCPAGYSSFTYENVNIMTCLTNPTVPPPLPNPLPDDWTEPQPDSHIKWTNGMLFMCPSGMQFGPNQEGQACTKTK